MSASYKLPSGEKSLMPKPGRHPYYIVAPPYTRFSAGIRAMHLLCHCLNRIGQNAFVLPASGVQPGFSPVNPELLTPILTAEVIVSHFEEKRTPIVVYPEVVRGNPLSAPVVARYVLNVPGLLGGDTSYAKEEMVFGYAKDLAPPEHPEQVMYLPTVDTNIFYPASSDQPRSGTCYYARKFKSLGGQLLEQTRDSIEITTDMTPQQIAEIFRKSELIYCYENTGISLEATLCGCPAVFLPNPHLTRIIGSDELGGVGMAWGDSPELVSHARNTVHLAFENYLSFFDKYWQQVQYFVEMTQARAIATPYERVLCAVS